MLIITRALRVAHVNCLRVQQIQILNTQYILETIHLLFKMNLSQIWCDSSCKANVPSSHSFWMIIFIFFCFHYE